MFYIIRNDIVAAENTPQGVVPIKPFKKFSDAAEKVIELSLNSKANFTIAKVVGVVEHQPAKVHLLE